MNTAQLGLLPRQHGRFWKVFGRRNKDELCVRESRRVFVDQTTQAFEILDFGGQIVDTDSSRMKTSAEDEHGWRVFRQIHEQVVE